MMPLINCVGGGGGGGFIIQDGGTDGSNAPTNTNVLWIDTNAQYGTGIIKFYNGTAWVPVIAAYNT